MILGIGLALSMTSGCATHHAQHSIPTAGRATPDWGTLKVFSTDNVPFEYEEIGFVTCSMWARHTVPPKEEDMLARFRDKAIRMGADAVLNFRYSSLYADLLVELSGVAVKIKKP
jgi:hypothetical protein